jgi:hypothetical protein
MPHPPWFKAKRYGYGWYPATWQGWLVMVIWLIFFAGAYVRWNLETQFPLFFVDIAASTGGLMVVAALTGEKPRWRWGRKERASRG